MTKYGRTWDSARARWRAHLAHLLPSVVTNYPFETFVAFLGLVIGLPLLLGIAAPTSLVSLLPTVVYWIYAAALCLGGVTVAVGLKFQRPLALASGLQLLGGSYAVYGIATVAVAGWAVAFLAFGAYAGLGVVCLVRSHHFRRLVDIARGARRLGPT